MEKIYISQFQYLFIITLYTPTDKKCMHIYCVGPVEQAVTPLPFSILFINQLAYEEILKTLDPTYASTRLKIWTCISVNL
jgi:hypothetical protein